MLQAVCRRIGVSPTTRVVTSCSLSRRSLTSAIEAVCRPTPATRSASLRLERIAAVATELPLPLPLPRSSSRHASSYRSPSMSTHRSMWSMSSVSPIVTRSTPLVAARMMSTSSSSDDTDHVQQQQQQQQDASSSITDTIIDNSNTASESFLSEVAVPKSTSFIWVPMEWIEAALTNVHELGAPWWLTIFGATFAVRTVLLPVMVMSVKNSAIMANLKPELEALKQKLTGRPGHDPAAAQLEYKTAVAELFRANHVNPLKSLVPALIQIPIFLFFFFTLRDMAHTVPSFAEGGMLWFKNLTVSDPYYRLPMLASLTMLASIEVSTMSTGGPQTQMQRIMKRVFQGFALALVPLTGGMPQAIHWYWIASNIFTTLQTFVLSRHVVKNALGIPISMPTTLLGSPVAPEPVTTLSHKPSKSAIAAALAAGKQRKSFSRK